MQGRATTVASIIKDIYPDFNPDISAVITTRCPFRCEHCIAYCMMRAYPNFDMETDYIKCIVDELEGSDGLFWVGGETMCYKKDVKDVIHGDLSLSPEFLELANYACSRMKRVYVDTSGFLIPSSPDEADEFFAQLPSNLAIILSIDEYHEKAYAQHGRNLQDVVDIVKQHDYIFGTREPYRWMGYNIRLKGGTNDERELNRILLKYGLGERYYYDIRQADEGVWPNFVPKSQNDVNLFLIQKCYTNCRDRQSYIISARFHPYLDGVESEAELVQELDKLRLANSLFQANPLWKRIRGKLSFNIQIVDKPEYRRLVEGFLGEIGPLDDYEIEGRDDSGHQIRYYIKEKQIIERHFFVNGIHMGGKVQDESSLPDTAVSPVKMSDFLAHAEPDNMFLFVTPNGDLVNSDHAAFLAEPPPVSIIGNVYSNTLEDIFLENLLGFKMNFEKYPALRSLVLAEMGSRRGLMEDAKKHLAIAQKLGGQVPFVDSRIRDIYKKIRKQRKKHFMAIEKGGEERLCLDFHSLRHDIDLLQDRGACRISHFDKDSEEDISDAQTVSSIIKDYGKGVCWEVNMGMLNNLIARNLSMSREGIAKNCQTILEHLLSGDLPFIKYMSAKRGNHFLFDSSFKVDPRGDLVFVFEKYPIRRTIQDAEEIVSLAKLILLAVRCTSLACDLDKEKERFFLTCFIDLLSGQEDSIISAWGEAFFDRFKLRSQELLGKLAESKA